MTTKIENNAVVLFQGDSITDHGRNRQDPTDLGFGYAMMVAAWFSALYPQQHVTFFNRGIGGDRVKDLIPRWDIDCLNLAPTCVSILVGVNNTLRRFDSGSVTSGKEFEQDYRILLERTCKRLNPQLVLCEPFLLPVTQEQYTWRQDLQEKIEIVRRLAHEFNAIHIPLDTIFAEAAQKREAAFWLYDGIHTTPAGAALIAQAWLKAVGAIS